MQHSTRAAPMHRQPVPPMNLPPTICTNCKFRHDFTHDCNQHEQQTTAVHAMLIVQKCTGFVLAEMAVAA